MPVREETVGKARAFDRRSAEASGSLEELGVAFIPVICCDLKVAVLQITAPQRANNDGFKKPDNFDNCPITDPPQHVKLLIKINI